jgi:hypothetical protein
MFIHAMRAGQERRSCPSWRSVLRGAATVVLLGLAVATRAATPAPDFNGDGFADLVVPVPFEDVGAALDAGAVHVLYGSAAGLTSSGSQFWHQNASGVAESAESDDRFGERWTFADFNSDGVDDLVVAVQREDVAAIGDAGAVHVFPGSAAGLTTAGAQYWHQNKSGVQDVSEAGDLFGGVLATGDFNGDGFADLAVGVPGEGVGAAPGAGEVQIFYGSAGSLTAAGNQFWTQNRAGMPDAAEAGDAFGESLSAGDFNGDGRVDLVIPVPDEDLGDLVDAGLLHVLYGVPPNEESRPTQLWSQESAGIADTAETGDRFGDGDWS